MLLNGPRPIGWSRVTCTLLDIHSPLATGPRIICTRMPRLRATAVAATDMTSPFYTVTAKVYTRAPERVKVNSQTGKRSANEREQTSPNERECGTANANEIKFTLPNPAFSSMCQRNRNCSHSSVIVRLNSPLLRQDG